MRRLTLQRISIGGEVSTSEPTVGRHAPDVPGGMLAGIAAST